MTRLRTGDIAAIGDDWRAFDRLMLDQLGLDLLELGAMAVERPAEEVRAALAGRRLAAVSISSGEGVVSGFAAGLAAIGRRLGLVGEVMACPDEAGFRQAESWGADFVIYADDDHYLARELATGRVADNNPATSRVFAAALERLNGAPLAGCEVVVLGLGIIGRGALERLAELGARPLGFDPDPGRREAAAESRAGEILAGRAELAEALRRTDLIFEATPVARALDVELWPAAPKVAAPGVPLSWPAQWLERGAAGRLWHDPLQSGTAAMLAQLV